MKHKFRQLPLIIGGLAAISLGSVGFSAWVIEGNGANSVSSNVTVKVGELTDKRITASAGPVSGNLSFDYDAKYHKEGNLITGTGTESLIFNTSVTLESDSGIFNSEAKNQFKSFTGFQFSITNSNSSAYSDCVRDNLIEAPFGTTFGNEIKVNTVSAITITHGAGTSVVSEINPLKYTIDVDEQNSTINKAIIKLSIGYRWGNAFSHTNPVKYVGSDTSLLENTKTNISKLHVLEGTTFTLNVKPIFK